MGVTTVRLQVPRSTVAAILARAGLNRLARLTPRVAYVEVLPDQRGETTARFLQRTLRWFARRGVRVERVLTDNGSAYWSRAFAATAVRGRVRLLRSRPYHPQTNGKAERFIQTLLRERAYAVPYAHSWERTRALKPWLRFYTRPGRMPPWRTTHRALAFRELRSEQPCWKPQLAGDVSAPLCVQPLGLCFSVALC